MSSVEEKPAEPTVAVPRIGMRLWLTGAFAAVSLITAVSVYLFGDDRTALVASVLVGVLAGFLIAVAISHRVVRLARAAGEMAGALSTPRSTSPARTRSATSPAPSTRCGPR